jgi:hypothetical protein
MANQRRVRRIKRRIARIERRLEVIADVGALELRGPLARWVEQLEARPGIDFDEDENGVVDFEELMDGVVEHADELIDLGPLGELVMDLGVRLFAEVAVTIYRNTEDRLRKRLERLRRRLATL